MLSELQDVLCTAVKHWPRGEVTGSWFTGWGQCSHDCGQQELAEPEVPKPGYHRLTARPPGAASAVTQSRPVTNGLYWLPSVDFAELRTESHLFRSYNRQFRASRIA